MSRKNIIRIVIGVCILAAAVIYCVCYRTLDESVDTITPMATAKKKESTKQQKETSKPASRSLCAVYICGAVKNPGVYELTEGELVAKAIELAGGFTKKADREAWNLAERISDGLQITIPLKDSKRKAADTTDNVEETGKVNLNTATKEELMTLSGIGEAKANAILAYRTEQGTFSKVEDIMQIEGIKEGVYRQIKDSIIVE